MPHTAFKWLHGSAALGINGTGRTVVIQVANPQAVEQLAGHHNVLQRALLTALDQGEYALELEAEDLALRLVPQESTGPGE
jgi:hypothetical protein